MALTDCTSASSAHRSVPQEDMGTDVRWAFGLLCSRNTWCREKYAAQLQMVCMLLKDGLKSPDSKRAHGFHINKLLKQVLILKFDDGLLMLSSH